MIQLRCVTCHTKVSEKEIDNNDRCSVCRVHFDQRTHFQNKMTQARSRYQDVRARKAKGEHKQAKHCPKCHHYRHQDQFIVFNDPYGSCEICRDELYRVKREGEIRAKKLKIEQDKLAARIEARKKREQLIGEWE